MLFVEAYGEDPVTILLAPYAGRHLVDVRLRLQIHVAVPAIDEDAVVVVFLTVPDRGGTTLARTLGRVISLIQHLANRPCGHHLVEGA